MAVVPSPEGTAVTLLNTTNGKKTELTTSGNPLSVAFAPNGKTVAVGTSAGVVDVFTVATGRLAVELKGDPKLQVQSLAYSPDGTRLVTGASPARGAGVVMVWDMKTNTSYWKMTRLPGGSTEGNPIVTYDALGKQVLVGDNDGSVRSYDAESGEFTGKQFTVSDSRVTSIAVSSDNSRFLLGGDAILPGPEAGAKLGLEPKKP